MERCILGKEGPSPSQAPSISKRKKNVSLQGNHSLVTHFFFSWSGWLPLQTPVSAACSDIPWSHALAPSHTAKGENRYLLAADSRVHVEPGGKGVGGQGHCGSLVASRTNAPAVKSPLSPPTYPTDVSLSLSCPQAIPVNDFCIATESPMWQLNLFTAQNCWCVHGSPVVVLHACRNRDGLGRGWGEELRKRMRKGSWRQRGQWNVKVTSLCLGN